MCNLDVILKIPLPLLLQKKTLDDKKENISKNFQCFMC